jgi:23S rRNA pseudouridine2604 synthase
MNDRNAETNDAPVRLSKLMSERGLCSRREADEYITRGWVFVDGAKVSEPSARVAATAQVTLDKSATVKQEQRITVILHKPIGYVSAQAEPGYQPASVLVTADRQMANDKTRFKDEHARGLAPAGRLDIDSTGLLVLTQDGRIAKHLIGEDSDVDKEYLVRVDGTLSETDLKLLNHGLSLDGQALKPAIVRWQNEHQLNFILREGKKRQIRRMVEMVGLRVLALKRIRIGKVRLGDLQMGQWRFLRQDEAF